MFVTGDSVTHSAYQEIDRDPATFIAISYDRSNTVSADGKRIVSADPHGMSGGALFLPIRQDLGQGETRPILGLAGVLVEYHKAPANVLVAVRIGPIIQSLPSAQSFGRPPFRLEKLSG